MTKKLPIASGTSAATTAFCAEKIDGPGGYLWIDGNGKITAGNGTLDEPKPNAFSLIPGNTDGRRRNCPGSTAVCRSSCYVHGLEKHAADTFRLYENNSTMIRLILGMPQEIALEWAGRMADWITKNAAGGFRWHVSGDIFSHGYAAWIAEVVRRSPTVKHWIYTRSFTMMWPLIGLANLALNLSCDSENYQSARVFAYNRGRGPLRLCYLTDDGAVPADLPPGSVVFPDYKFRGGPGTEFWDSLLPQQRKMVCPVDVHGKSETRRCGPCSKCLD